MVERINVINQKMALEEAHFERLQKPMGQAKAVLVDEILDFDLQNAKISFKYKRTLRVEPKSIYYVYVIFSYESDITEESIISLQNGGNLNKDYLKEKAPSMVESTTLCSVASQVISNLTAINGNRPFISPPVFIKKS